MKTEMILPVEDRIDTHLDDYFTEVIAEIEQILQRVGDVIDPKYEFESIRSLEHFKIVAEYLSTEIYQYGGDTVRETAAAYRGLLFGYQVASIMHGDTVRMDFAQLAGHAETEQPYKSFTAEVDEYLNSNTTVDNLIIHFIQEIDEGRNLQFMARQAAGTVLMLAERSRGDDYLTEMAGNLSVEDVA